MSYADMKWAVDYSKGPPPEYRCDDCGASNVKLWREYQTFLSQQRLRCCDCAAKDQGRDVSDIDSNGRRTTPEYEWGKDQRSDQIGWLIPAVPSESGDTFWGYTSVPGPGVEWWRRIPTRATPSPSDVEKK
jgi:hypothetical protein